MAFQRSCQGLLKAFERHYLYRPPKYISKKAFKTLSKGLQKAFEKLFEKPSAAQVPKSLFMHCSLISV